MGRKLAVGSASAVSPPTIGDIAIYICRDPVDFRMGINGLSVMVEATLKYDPFSRNLFCFVNKRKNQIKVLYWQRTGFCLWSKRLEEERFKSYDPCQYSADDEAAHCSGAAAIEGSEAIGMGQDAEFTRRSLRLLFGGWVPHDDGASEGCLALATDVSVFARPT